MSNDTITSERKVDLEGNTWVLKNPDYPDEGWIKESDKSFPMAEQDGGRFEVDGDEDGEWHYFVPEFYVPDKCPFCDSMMGHEFDGTNDGNVAYVSAYCDNHGAEKIWFPWHEVTYEASEYEGDTWVPYGDTYVKLPY